MKRSMHGLAAWTMAAIWALACDEARPPTAPTSGSSTTPPLAGGGNVGSGMPTADAGADAGSSMIIACDEIAVSSELNRVTVSGSGAADAFVATRVYALWDTARCNMPTLLIGLTAGSCSLGNGQRLVLALPAAAIDDGTIDGPYLVESRDLPTPGTPAVTVDYVAPAVITGTEERTWGNCGPGAAGLVSFMQPPQALPGGLLQASFSLLLDDCTDDPPTTPQITVEGAFSVTLRQSREEACGN